MSTVTPDALFNTLQPILGSAVLTNAPQIINGCLNVMNNRQREDLSEIATMLDSIIFNGLYDVCGEKMTLRLDNGRIVRIYLNDPPIDEPFITMSDVVDLAMKPFLESLDVYRIAYTQIYDYYIEHASLSALIVLQLKYTRFQNEKENEIQVRALHDRLGDALYSSIFRN